MGNNNDTLYLFRFTNKGPFIPYEYCMDEYNDGEYNDGELELRGLNILLNKGFKDANITQREWADKRCSTLLDDCVCGYCQEDEIEINGTENVNVAAFNKQNKMDI